MRITWAMHAEAASAATASSARAGLLRKWSLPLRDHYPTPSTSPCHDQARSGVLHIRSQQLGEQPSLRYLNGCNLKGWFFFFFFLRKEKKKKKEKCAWRKKKEVKRWRLNFLIPLKDWELEGGESSKAALWFSPQECPLPQLDMWDKTQVQRPAPPPQEGCKPSELLGHEFKGALKPREFLTWTSAGTGFQSRVAEKDWIPS